MKQTCQRAFDLRMLAVLCVAIAVGALSMVGPVSGSEPASALPTADALADAAWRDQAQMVDYETVYAVLAPDGQVVSTTVVDWIRCPAGGPARVFDPGDLTDVQNVRGPEVPEFAEKGLVWAADPARVTDINYSGKTDRPLPVSVAITYCLDGEEIRPEEVPGCSGRLEIRVGVRNTTGCSRVLPGGEPLDVCVPMIVQISSDVPLPSYRRIDAPEAAAVLVGKSLKVNWMLFPSPDACAVLALEGDDMHPAGFEVSVIPSMPPVPQMDVVDQLRELASALAALDSAIHEAERGAARMADGGREAGVGVAALEEGLRDLARLADAHYMIAKSMDEGLSGPALEAPLRLAELAEADMMILTQIAEGVNSAVSMLPMDLITGFGDGKPGLAAGFVQGAISQVADADTAAQGLSRALASHAQTAASAKTAGSDGIGALEALAREYPSIAKSSEYAALSAALKKQDNAINMLNTGGRVGFSQVPALSQMAETARALASNTAKLKIGANLASGYLSQSDEIVAQAMQAVAALNAVVYGGEIEGAALPGMDVLCDGLRQIGEGMTELKQGTGLLASGGDVEGQQLPGTGGAAEALREASSGAGAVRDGSQQLAEGLAQLADGLSRMRREGTLRIVAELDHGLREAERGQAILAAMQERLDGYESFIGKPEGARGETRFLLKIRAPERGDAAADGGN